MNKYTKRAQDSLDLNVVVDVCLSRVKTACKSAVAHTAALQMNRLKDSKLSLERELETVQVLATGLLGWIKHQARLREIKNKLLDINAHIVTWINSVYRYFDLSVQGVKSC